MNTPAPDEITVESWLVSAGRPEEAGSPLNVPLVPASNFILGSRYEYSRDDGTLTWEALEAIVGRLTAERPEDGYASAASLLEDLDRAGAEVPANAEAWERLLRHVRENAPEEPAYRQSA